LLIKFSRFLIGRFSSSGVCSRTGPVSAPLLSGGDFHCKALLWAKLLPIAFKQKIQDENHVPSQMKIGVAAQPTPASQISK